jgi:hypothetical protein
VKTAARFLLWNDFCRPQCLSAALLYDGARVYLRPCYASPYLSQVWTSISLSTIQPSPPPLPPAPPAPESANYPSTPTVILGPMLVQALDSYQCLSAEGGNPRALVYMEDCAFTPRSSSLWLAADAGGGHVFLKEQASGSSRSVLWPVAVEIGCLSHPITEPFELVGTRRCLTVPTATVGEFLNVMDCNGGPNQQFQLQLIPSSAFNLPM